MGGFGLTIQNPNRPSMSHSLNLTSRDRLPSVAGSRNRLDRPLAAVMFAHGGLPAITRRVPATRRTERSLESAPWHLPQLGFSRDGVYSVITELKSHVN